MKSFIRNLSSRGEAAHVILICFGLGLLSIGWFFTTFGFEISWKWRQLCPLIVAHSLMDFIALLSLADHA